MGVALKSGRPRARALLQEHASSGIGHGGLVACALQFTKCWKRNLMRLLQFNENCAASEEGGMTLQASPHEVGSRMRALVRVNILRAAQS